jgi:hypothetical protein
MKAKIRSETLDWLDKSEPEVETRMSGAIWSDFLDFIFNWVCILNQIS